MRPQDRSSFLLVWALALLACSLLPPTASAQPPDPCGRDITVGDDEHSYGPEFENPSGPEPPSEIKYNNEGGIQFLAGITPTEGAVRDRHEVSLQNGQLEYTIPLGVGGKGRGGHDLFVDIHFRSGVYNMGSLVSPFASFGLTDIIVAECSIVTQRCPECGKPHGD
ncbi:MAG: hypothetical protein AB1486_35530, partial [Planctomycetota bacterium]